MTNRLYVAIAYSFTLSQVIATLMLLCIDKCILPSTSNSFARAIVG